MTRHLDFFFFIGSTYTYLTVMRIEELAARADAAVNWRPYGAIPSRSLERSGQSGAIHRPWWGERILQRSETGMRPKPSGHAGSEYSDHPRFSRPAKYSGETIVSRISLNGRVLTMPDSSRSVAISTTSPGSGSTPVSSSIESDAFSALARGADIAVVCTASYLSVMFEHFRICLEKGANVDTIESVSGRCVWNADDYAPEVAAHVRLAETPAQFATHMDQLA